LNEDIKLFPQVHPITEDMKLTHKGVSRLVMLDRYAFKDTGKKTLKAADFVVLTVKADPTFPARGTGFIHAIDWEHKQADILVDPEFLSVLDDEEEINTGIVKRSLDVLDTPLEVFYEQIDRRSAAGDAEVEKSKEKQELRLDLFDREQANLEVTPAGRVLYGAGAEPDATYSVCYVIPDMQEALEGISDHRKLLMEI